MNAVLPVADIGVCPTLCAKCAARQVSICNILPHAALRRLDDCLVVKSYTHGEIIASEGEPAQHVFNVTDGAAMLTRSMADGRRQVLGFLFKGDFVGLTQRGEYGFNVEAVNRRANLPFSTGSIPTPAARHAQSGARASLTGDG